VSAHRENTAKGMRTAPNPPRITCYGARTAAQNNSAESKIVKSGGFSAAC
jgi:hypothetical protein